MNIPTPIVFVPHHSTVPTRVERLNREADELDWCAHKLREQANKLRAEAREIAYTCESDKLSW